MGVSDVLDEAATQLWENLKDDPDAYIELRPPAVEAHRGDGGN